jgi:hypothetical protein
MNNKLIQKDMLQWKISTNKMKILYYNLKIHQLNRTKVKMTLKILRKLKSITKLNKNRNYMHQMIIQKDQVLYFKKKIIKKKVKKATQF